MRAGLRRPSPADHTFDELADYWEKHRAPLKRSEKDDLSILRKHLRPAFGKLRLRDIAVQSIDAFKEARDHLSPKTVGNCLVLLGTMFRQAEELGWLHTAPRIRKPSVDPDDEVDPPWLKAEEIDRLLVAALAEAKPDQALTEVTHVLYATTVYTGMRAGEAAGLKWSDVDLERRTIAPNLADQPTAAHSRASSGAHRPVPVLRLDLAVSPLAVHAYGMNARTPEPGSPITSSSVRRSRPRKTRGRGGVGSPSDGARCDAHRRGARAPRTARHHRRRRRAHLARSAPGLAR